MLCFSIFTLDSILPGLVPFTSKASKLQSLSALPSNYCERRWVNFSFAVKFYPLWDERNLSVITWTVLSCKACENTLCPVGTESKPPFEATGCHFSELQCLFQCIIHYLTIVFRCTKEAVWIRKSLFSHKQIQWTLFNWC